MQPKILLPILYQDIQGSNQIFCQHVLTKQFLKPFFILFYHIFMTVQILIVNTINEMVKIIF